MPQPPQQQTPPGTTADMEPTPDHGERSYEGSGRLSGKRAVITGGDSGIGRAVAIAFAREGADVLISYLNEDEDAAETADWVRRADRRAVTLSGDLASPDHCRQVVATAVHELGGIDILVSNAAFQMTRETIEEIPDEDMVASLAQALAERGIRVNGVAPGPIWTPLIPSTMPEEAVESFGEQTPLQRPGQPVELAPIYVMLASEEVSYVSGAIVPATGGRPML